ncbi:MAG: hypothetical protein RL154_1454 [Pseudomonadota bacterium]|jgi:hypothetical protein
MYKPQIIILCEDRAHYHFIRSFCLENGWNERQIIKVFQSPFAVGFAEQYVKNKYFDIVKLFRSKIGQNRNIALIVMIDGDMDGIAKRKADFESLAQRTYNEKIAIFVPTRNIQSWFKILDSSSNFDENVDYKQKYKNASPAKYAKELNMLHQQKNCPLDSLSLLDACDEWKRI